MPLLNTAKGVYIGATKAKKAYVGATVVWTGRQIVGWNTLATSTLKGYPFGDEIETASGQAEWWAHRSKSDLHVWFPRTGGRYKVSSMSRSNKGVEITCSDKPDAKKGDVVELQVPVYDS